MTYNELVEAVEDHLPEGFTKKDIRDVLAATASAVEARVKAGEDVSIPKLVRISFGYRPARAKGDTVVGFGGEERVLDKAQPEVVKINVSYPGGKKKLLPSKGTKAYKAVVARKTA